MLWKRVLGAERHECVDDTFVFSENRRTYRNGFQSIDTTGGFILTRNHILYPTCQIVDSKRYEHNLEGVIVCEKSNFVTLALCFLATLSVLERKYPIGESQKDMRAHRSKRPC